MKKFIALIICFITFGSAPAFSKTSEIAVPAPDGSLVAQHAKTIIQLILQSLVNNQNMLKISVQNSENTQQIKNLEKIIIEQQKLIQEHERTLKNLSAQMNETLKKSEVSPIILNLKTEEQKEFLLLNGRPAYADETYINIYSKAQENILIIDDYINLKTLRLLREVKSGVSVTVISDNAARDRIYKSDYDDFTMEFPSIFVKFITNKRLFHDRYIILDYDTPSERIFLCGSSSKDSGVKRISTIVELFSSDVQNLFHDVIEKALENPRLRLK